MQRSNQPAEPECCRREGQANAAKEGGGAERLVGSVHREIREPQAGVAFRLSNSASKSLAAGGDVVHKTEPETNSAVKGEALAGLPESKSVAREDRTVRNPGEPAISRRTSYEGQAGRTVRRQEGQAQRKPGVGSLHSSSGQGTSPELSEGGDGMTPPHRKPSPYERRTHLGQPPSGNRCARHLEEPGAGILHAGICEGGAGQPASLVRL